jgi:hypothetical protein
MIESVDPFELHPEEKEKYLKKVEKILTKQKVFDILDSEIVRFKRIDNLLIANIIEKIKTKINKLE